MLANDNDDNDNSNDSDVRIVRGLDMHCNRCADRTCVDLKWRNDDDEDNESSEKAKLSSDAVGPSPSSNTPSKFTWHADMGTMNTDWRADRRERKEGL